MCGASLSGRFTENVLCSSVDGGSPPSEYAASWTSRTMLKILSRVPQFFILILIPFQKSFISPSSKIEQVDHPNGLSGLSFPWNNLILQFFLRNQRESMLFFIHLRSFFRRVVLCNCPVQRALCVRIDMRATSRQPKRLRNDRNTASLCNYDVRRVSMGEWRHGLCFDAFGHKMAPF